MIKYSVSMFGTGMNPGQTKKASARVQTRETVSMEDFARHISSHNSKWNTGDVYAVLYEATQCLKELVLAGNKVSLGTLGCFLPTLKSRSADSVEAFTQSNIQSLTIHWEKPQNLYNLLGETTLQQVSTLKAQQAALEAERNGETSANWDKTENPDGEGDNAVTPDNDDTPTGGNTGGSNNDDPNG